MLVKDDELNKRLNNPLNLMNRLRSVSGNDKRKNAMALFIPTASQKLNGKEINNKKVEFKNPFVRTDEVIETKPLSVEEVPPAENHPNTNELIEDADAKVKLALAHDNSLKLLNDAVSMMQVKLDDIKPEKLPAVIASTSKVVESIRRERLERSVMEKDSNVHYHFYAPGVNKIENYEVVNVAN